MEEEEISVGEFVSRLFEFRFRTAAVKPAQSAAEDILRYGHYRGWLEDQDERYPNATLNRQTAARIIHQFLKLECNVPDLADIAPALRLRDLYNCRACAEHIAQVYTRGIIKEESDFSDSSNDSVILFNHLAPVTKTEAQKILEQLLKLIA